MIVIGRGFLGQLPGIHDQDAVGDLVEDRDIVGDDDGAFTAFPVAKFNQHLRHSFLAGDIQR